MNISEAVDKMYNLAIETEKISERWTAQMEFLQKEVNEGRGNPMPIVLCIIECIELKRESDLEQMEKMAVMIEKIHLGRK